MLLMGKYHLRCFEHIFTSNLARLLIVKIYSMLSSIGGIYFVL